MSRIVYDFTTGSLFPVIPSRGGARPRAQPHDRGLTPTGTALVFGGSPIRDPLTAATWHNGLNLNVVRPRFLPVTAESSEPGLSPPLLTDPTTYGVFLKRRYANNARLRVELTFERPFSNLIPTTPDPTAKDKPLWSVAITIKNGDQTEQLSDLTVGGTCRFQLDPIGVAVNVTNANVLPSGTNPADFLFPSLSYFDPPASSGIPATQYVLRLELDRRSASGPALGEATLAIDSWSTSPKKFNKVEFPSSSGPEVEAIGALVVVPRGEGQSLARFLKLEVRED